MQLENKQNVSKKIMQANIEKWLKIALINLCIVALLGIILRYKIAFPLPFVSQSNVHHGHSHFAFSGWISQAIMILLVYYLHKKGQKNLVKRYGWILIANLIVSYGMLISFLISIYTFIPILFSTLCIFVSYIFAVLFWKDLNKLKSNLVSHLWFKAALFFSAISSIGPFVLGFLMANHMINQKAMLVSVYYFLHFQYNGWFIFACMGLFVSKLEELTGEQKKLKTIFWIFALSCIPCYFLSALWLPIPLIVYIIIVISAVMQLLAWIMLIGIIRNHFSTLIKELPGPARWLMLLAAISMTIKLILQVCSTYPSLSQLAYGFRPIVIGYLHLVFLAIITIFLLGYMISEKLLVLNRTIKTGLVIFVSGVFINEILLMTQGVFALETETVPHMNELLFSAAIIMFTGLLLIIIKQFPSHFSTRIKTEL